MLVNVPLSPNTRVDNPMVGYPAITTLDLVTTVRIDKSFGEELLAEKIREAMDTVNKQVSFTDLPTIDQIRCYKRAVSYEAAALIGEDNLDYDTTSGGQIRGENGLSKSDVLRRKVQYAIADLTGRPRHRVKLI
jgi:hypothetical protein